MRKIVINKCYGGFGLSIEAYEFIAKEKGWHIVRGADPLWKFTYWHPTIDGIDSQLTEEEQEELMTDLDLSRDDPDLVNCVEILKERANGPYAELRIVEIPDDIKWEIDEYGGIEHVAEVHRTWY